MYRLKVSVPYEFDDGDITHDLGFNTEEHEFDAASEEDAIQKVEAHVANSGKVILGEKRAHQPLELTKIVKKW